MQQYSYPLKTSLSMVSTTTPVKKKKQMARAGHAGIAKKNDLSGKKVNMKHGSNATSHEKSPSKQMAPVKKKRSTMGSDSKPQSKSGKRKHDHAQDDTDDLFLQIAEEVRRAKKKLQKERKTEESADIAQNDKEADDIDDIFAVGKQRKAEQQIAKAKVDPKGKRPNPEDDNPFDTSLKRRKYVDGLPVYSVDELNIGQGGDTELCPFDCDCCY